MLVDKKFMIFHWHKFTNSRFSPGKVQQNEWKKVFAHTTGSLGISHMTKRWAVAFVASTNNDLPTYPPKDLSFVCSLNVTYVQI